MSAVDRVRNALSETWVGDGDRLRRGGYTLHVLEHKSGRLEVLGGAKTGTTRLHRAWINPTDTDEDVRRKIEDELLPDLYADAGEHLPQHHVDVVNELVAEYGDTVEAIRAEHDARAALAAELAPLFGAKPESRTFLTVGDSGNYVDVAAADAVSVYLTSLTADQARKIAEIVRPTFSVGA